MSLKTTIINIFKLDNTSKTATEVYHLVKVFNKTSLASVSSILLKLVNDKIMVWEKDYGPRGGYGYHLDI